MKKYIKYLMLVAIIIAVFAIYQFFPKEKINYIALGDSLAAGQSPYGEIGYSYADYLKERLDEQGKINYYSKKYSVSGYETTDIINEIVKNSEIKRELRESDLVTISIGANDFLHSLDLKNLNLLDLASYYKKIEEILPKLDSCLKEIRKYAKNDFYIIGYYNPIPTLYDIKKEEVDQLFQYIDREYEKLAKKYDASYISNYELFKTHKDYLPNPMDIHPNLDGYRAIADQIEEKLKSEKKS